jgi:hypothetical protein
MLLGKPWLLVCLGGVLCAPLSIRSAEGLAAGPFAQEFSLTLSGGRRTEAAGPLLSYQLSDGVREWTFGPLLSNRRDPDTDSEEFDFAYPLLTYHRFGSEYRLQFLQLLDFTGGQNPHGAAKKRFDLFPFYFHQRSTDPKENYTALVPFYGHLENRFFRDDIRFVMFPLYVRTRKKDVVTDNYLLPLFDVRHGEGLRGWQLWPLVGHEHKEVTTRTNSFGEVETVGGHDKLFAAWPLFFNQRTGIGTTNPARTQVFLPFYSRLRSPNRDSTTWVWPLFTHTNDRERKYREWDLPWPFVVFARGEGKTADRVWPFFSHAYNATHETRFYLWPLYRSTRIRSAPLDRRRVRVLFYLYSDVTEKNTATRTTLRRTDLWPLFTARRDHHGNERFQLLALLEPFLPNNPAIARSYAPLWSIWRSERNPATGRTSQSLLWNLYRREAGPKTKKYSLLFGLFQYQSTPDGKRWRLFYLPVAHTGSRLAPPSRSRQ